MSPPHPVQNWHTLSIEEVAQHLKVNVDHGLTNAEAAERLATCGPNRFVEATRRPPLTILISQFKSLIVLLLLAATTVAFFLGETVEAFAILIVIFINALIGFLMEWKAESALSELRRQTVATAHVIREGTEHRISATDIVPGDVVILAAGDQVPADGRLLEAVRLQTEEAALTGESTVMSKSTEPLADPDAVVGDRFNTVYRGTNVSNGRGRFIVTETGMHTEMGRIGSLIAEIEHQTSPLERKLHSLGNTLVIVVLGLCAVIVGAGWLRGIEFFYMLEVGISLAIAAVPEGLPAVATMTLAIGMQRMARMNTLVRRLPAVETLGSTTIICSDKTGTLTKNEMTVNTFQLAERRIAVEGGGYGLEGRFLFRGESLVPREDPHLELALRLGALCNDARIERIHGDNRILGDPTEGALLVAAEKAGLAHEELLIQYPRIDEIPFSSETKRMATFHTAPDGRTLVAVKGAVSAVLDSCARHVTSSGIRPLTRQNQQDILALNTELAGRALRVLALACSDSTPSGEPISIDHDLTFVGLVGMADPLRDEVLDAVAICREAGIRVIMITGDQVATAAEIGRYLGITIDSRGHSLKTVHGRDLTSMGANGWQDVVSETSVFARVSPEHKLRIVEALQRRGEIVAMTGDGVNDAPALRKADIGIAMGIKGTQVAKDASDMVITDDNFATIVYAVEQGRIIYTNIIRFVHYLFSCNLSEILTVFIAIMIGWPLPLSAIQILWLNMITDVFPALALVLEPSSPDIMKRPPRDPKEPLMSRRFTWLVTWQATIICTATLVAFFFALRRYESDVSNIRHAGTVAFMTLALSQIFHAFSARSQKRSAASIFTSTNWWLWAAVIFSLALQIAAVHLSSLNRLLHTVPMNAWDWSVTLSLALAPVAAVEIVKISQRIFSSLRSGAQYTH